MYMYMYIEILPVTDLLHFLANLVSPVRDEEHHTLGRLSLQIHKNGTLQNKATGWGKRGTFRTDIRLILLKLQFVNLSILKLRLKLACLPLVNTDDMDK